MGLFKPRPAQDYGPVIAQGLDRLQGTLLAVPDKWLRRRQAKMTALAEANESSLELLEQQGRAAELMLRAANEVAAWAASWPRDEADRPQLPPATSQDTTGFVPRAADALVRLTLSAPDAHYVRILVSQGVDMQGARIGYVCQQLPTELKGFGRSDWDDERLHIKADMMVLCGAVETYCGIVPLWPNGQQKRDARVLASAFSAGLFSWMCWSDDQGLTAALGEDGHPKPGDPRLE